mgnify:CR=1 FL=1
MLSKKILTDWSQAFPSLRQFSNTNKLLKVAGPVLIGIELIRLPHTGGYRPGFVMYQLWDSDVKECMSGSLVLNQLNDDRGLQFDIKINEHETKFEQAVTCMKNDTPFLLEKNIHVNQLKKLIDDYSDTSPFQFRENSFAKAFFQASKVKLALYINTAEAVAEFQKIKTVEWDAENFKMFNTEVDTWLEDLQHIVEDRRAFLKVIDINKSHPKIRKLNFLELDY